MNLAREAGERIDVCHPLRGLNFVFAMILGLTPEALCCRRLRRLVGGFYLGHVKGGCYLRRRPLSLAAGGFFGAFATVSG